VFTSGETFLDEILEWDGSFLIIVEVKYRDGEEIVVVFSVLI
jgi:hypothetical protein